MQVPVIRRLPDQSCNTAFVISRVSNTPNVRAAPQIAAPHPDEYKRVDRFLPLCVIPTCELIRFPEQCDNYPLAIARHQNATNVPLPISLLTPVLAPLSRPAHPFS